MSSSPDHFPLRGCCVGISISAGDDGIPPGEKPDNYVNQLTFQTCSRYLYLGASIALGHMWRPGGIMQHLIRKASEFRYSFSVPGASDRRPPIINRLAWPDEPPAWDEDEREEFQDFVEVKQVVPPDIPTTGLDPKSPLGKFARIRALSSMRQELVAQSQVRICLGGAPGKPLRRLPGVIEEAVLSYQAGSPVYLAGAFGGATKAVCDAILHRRMSSEAVEMFYTPSEALTLFQEFGSQYPVPIAEGPSLPNSANDVLSFVSKISVESLAERSSLSVEDYLTLMTTPDAGRALQLVTVAISKRTLK